MYTFLATLNISLIYIFNTYYIYLIYTRARSIFKSNVRKAKFTHAKQQTRKLENMRFKNAKEYWKLLKNAGGQRKASGVSANNFYDYFKAINNPDDRFFQPDDAIFYFNERIVKDEFQVMFQELDVEFSMGEINKAVKNLKNSKSAGPDLIINEFLKYGFHVLKPYLHKLFNARLGGRNHHRF